MWTRRHLQVSAVRFRAAREAEPRLISLKNYLGNIGMECVDLVKNEQRMRIRHLRVGQAFQPDTQPVRLESLTYTPARGSLTWKVVPWPSWLVAPTVPCMAWTRCLTIDSPRPVPPRARERALSTR